jgi:hypothetical protein
MGARGRTTQHKEIARSFGGRSGFVSEEMDPVPSAELLLAVGIVVLVVGGYGAFIAYLALTR